MEKNKKPKIMENINEKKRKERYIWERVIWRRQVIGRTALALGGRDREWEKKKIEGKNTVRGLD